jgi:hypothetical protein
MRIVAAEMRRTVFSCKRSASSELPQPCPRYWKGPGNGPFFLLSCVRGGEPDAKQSHARFRVGPAAGDCTRVADGAVLAASG